MMSNTVYSYLSSEEPRVRLQPCEVLISQLLDTATRIIQEIEELSYRRVARSGSSCLIARLRKSLQGCASHCKVAQVATVSHGSAGLEFRISIAPTGTPSIEYRP